MHDLLTVHLFSGDTHEGHAKYHRVANVCVPMRFFVILNACDMREICSLTFSWFVPYVHRGHPGGPRMKALGRNYLYGRLVWTNTLKRQLQLAQNANRANHLLLLLHCVHGSGSTDHGHTYTLTLLDLLTFSLSFNQCTFKID